MVGSLERMSLLGDMFGMKGNLVRHAGREVNKPRSTPLGSSHRFGQEADFGRKLIEYDRRILVEV